VTPRFDVYKAVSQQIREIFAEHTPIIEPLSLDEAYLAVTENLQNIPLARDVALAIRTRIKEVTGLNAYNKFLAKLTSDHREPNGQNVIPRRHELGHAGADRPHCSWSTGTTSHPIRIGRNGFAKYSRQCWSSGGNTTRLLRSTVLLLMPATFPRYLSMVAFQSG
jgi:hypothetical protein